MDMASSREIDILKGFSPEEMSTLLKSCDRVDFKAGETIFSAGGMERGLYFLRQGSVEILFDVPGFQETMIVTLEPPAVFGESTFFHSAPHGATARTVTAVETVRLGRPEYDRMLDENWLPAFKLGTNAADILGSRLQAADRWISEILEHEENTKHAPSWRRFRESMHPTFEFPHAFFGVRDIR